MSTTTTERAGSVEFKVLGNVEVVTDGQPLALGGRKSREVLAYLLLHANESVSQGRIVEALWGDDAPLTVDSSLRVAISKLRKALEPAGARDRLETGPAGYLLRVEPELIDAHGFDTRAAEGRLALEDDRPQEAAAHLGDALSLWRGDPYSEIASCADAAMEQRRLTSRRFDVQDDLSDAQLALGQHETLVPGLEALVAEQPTRERRAAQLMLALYRSGRQAEALAVYARTRTTLNNELGLEPGPQLRELQQAVLRQDPALATSRAPKSPAVGETVTAPTFSRRRVAVAVAALASAAVLALVVAWVARGRHDTSTTAAPNSAAVLDQHRPRVVASVSAGARPIDIVLADGSAWIANGEDGTVTRVDMSTRRVVDTIGIGFEPTGIAADDRAVWVVGGYDHQLVRIDTSDAHIRLRVHFRERIAPLAAGYERGPAGVAVGHEGVWVSHGVEVTRFDPKTGAVERSVRAGGPWSSSVALGEGHVWVAYDGPLGANQRAPAVDVVDATAGDRRTRIPVVARVSDLAIANGYAWAALGVGDSVWRIDPQRLDVDTTMPAGDDPVSLALDDDDVWVSNKADATVTRLDPRTGTKRDVIPVGHTLEGIAASRGEVWVAVREP